jgi:hypothetical protein
LVVSVRAARLGSAGIKADAIGIWEHGPGGGVWQAPMQPPNHVKSIKGLLRLAARNDDPDRNPGKSRRNVAALPRNGDRQAGHEFCASCAVSVRRHRQYQ